MIRAVIFALVVVPIGVSAADAQTIEAPPRVTPPPRTVGTTHSLVLDTSVFGRYVPGDLPGGGVLVDPSIRPGALSSWGSASLRYSIDGGPRSFTVAGGGTANTNSSSNEGPVYGNNVNASFSTPLSQSLSLSISQSASRAPYYTTGVFGGVPPGWYSPDNNPTNGIFDGYLLSLASSAGLRYAATRHTGVSVNYSYQTSRHEASRSSNFTYADHFLGLNVIQQITRSIGTQLSYTAVRRQAEQSSLVYDGLTHRFSYGVNFSHPISATRTLAMTFGGGAELVDMGTDQYWQPTYFGSIGTDIGRSWSLHGNYSYMTVMLYSPLAAPDSYVTQTLVTGVGGDLTRHLSLGVHFGASRGNVPANLSITGSAGQYSGVSAGAQLRVQLTTAWSAVVSSNYYRSDLVGAAALFLRSSADYQKTTLLGGLAWNVPLLDSGRIGRRSPG